MATFNPPTIPADGNPMDVEAVAQGLFNWDNVNTLSASNGLLDDSNLPGNVTNEMVRPGSYHELRQMVGGSANLDFFTDSYGKNRDMAEDDASQPTSWINGFTGIAGAGTTWTNKRQARAVVVFWQITAIASNNYGPDAYFATQQAYTAADQGFDTGAPYDPTKWPLGGTTDIQMAETVDTWLDFYRKWGYWDTGGTNSDGFYDQMGYRLALYVDGTRIDFTDGRFKIGRTTMIDHVAPGSTAGVLDPADPYFYVEAQDWTSGVPVASWLPNRFPDLRTYSGFLVLDNPIASSPDYEDIINKGEHSAVMKVVGDAPHVRVKVRSMGVFPIY